jgi:SAM-dependent methyltransferase
MPDGDPIEYDVPLSHLPAEEKARRSGSFGEAATEYERFRPGPPMAAVEWLLPAPVGRVVDLGAGTGALTRLLIDRAGEVVAVEPDDRMRAILAREVPGATAVAGRGESIPLPDGCADAVMASSSWHWMDPVPTLAEVRRVLAPGGFLAALWSGPDPEGPFLVQAREMLAGQASGGGGDGDGGGDGQDLGELVLGDGYRPVSSLEIPTGVAFAEPELKTIRWDVALTADDLVGLLATFSWIITMAEEQRLRVFGEARRLLRDLMGVEGEVTVDVAFRADVWRTQPA